MKKSVLLILFLAACAVQPADDSAPIGFIGCSNTGQTVEGYHAVGGERIWTVDRTVSINQGTYPPFGGGTVNKWAEPGSIYWQVFDQYLSLNPGTKTVWWQLCIKQTDELSFENAQSVLAELRDRIPDVTVYVSPLPTYPDHLCGIVGRDGFGHMNALAQELAEKESDVLPGPLLPGIPKSQTVQDGCHMNEAGKRKVGVALKEFFDS